MGRVQTCADSSPDAIHDELASLPQWGENGARRLRARCSRLKPRDPVCSRRAFRPGACSRRRLRSRSQKARRTVRLGGDPRHDFRGLMCSYLISFPGENWPAHQRRTDVLLTERNLLRLRFLGLRQRHGQDSILIFRTHFVCIDPYWKRDAPTEFPDVTLRAFDLLAIRSLAPSLAADR